MWTIVFLFVVISAIAVALINRFWSIAILNLTLLLILLLSSCATQEEKVLAKHCRETGTAAGDMRCAKPKPPLDTRGMVKYCEYRGVKRDDSRDCVWITQEELQRILRSMGR